MIEKLVFSAQTSYEVEIEAYVLNSRAVYFFMDCDK